MRKKPKSKKLHFEPTIFRDWSITYCELAWISATKKFEEQFGWSYSDLIFLWDRKKEILYRAQEEHYHGMFRFIAKKIRSEKNFIKKISQLLLKDITKYKRLLEKWLRLDLDELDNDQLFLILNALKEKYLPLLPRFLIIMYFPQQIEQYYSNHAKNFKKELKICLDIRAKVDKILAPLTEKFLKKLGNQTLKNSKVKDYEDYGRFLSLQEIKMILDGSYSKKKIINLERKLKKRKKYFLFAGGKIKYSSLKGYLKRRGWQLIEHKDKKGLDFIEGKAAYKNPNRIKGKVKIVENKAELFKIKKGDIIVAPMTTPEYAPIFSKVSAIITDEGGITSHAAIVSRELKIPSIVGTKIATKILDDGDYVEVDTNKNVVKILRKLK